jgi:hypothetical protein
MGWALPRYRPCGIVLEATHGDMRDRATHWTQPQLASPWVVALSAYVAPRHSARYRLTMHKEPKPISLSYPDNHTPPTASRVGPARPVFAELVSAPQSRLLTHPRTTIASGVALGVAYVGAVLLVATIVVGLLMRLVTA